MSKIAITGGSGLLGIQVTKILLSKGHEVVHLTRQKNSRGGVKTFVWDYKKGTIEKGGMEGIDFLVHLAGEGIAAKPWTFKRKKLLVSSRADTASFLHDYVTKNNIQLKGFISASGTSYYDQNDFETVFTEESLGTDQFMSRCVHFWEQAADKFNDSTRVTKLRFGIILDRSSGAFPKLTGSAKMYMGAALGSGDQAVPWIHIQDASALVVHAIEKETVSGSYNAVATDRVNNREFMQQTRKVIGRFTVVKRVPKRLLRFLYSEMSDLIVLGAHASNDKIKETGFEFKYDKLENALEDLLKKN